MRVCSVCSRCYDDPILHCSEDGHPPLSEGRDGSSDMIAGYRLEYLAENGANGETYRARQTESSTPCLIRILSADHLNSEQFLYEAKLAAALFHPHLADIYEAGTLENGNVFVVMEGSGCETLRERLEATGTPDLLTTIEIMRQTSEALHGLHLKDLTHRAVRPENIILSIDAEGREQIRIQNLDFGGVRQHSIVSNRFLIESALESLKYFAPEQFDDEAATSQTDIYSLGIVFYEMLAGAPPFSASKAAAVIEKHRNQPPPDIKIADFNLRMLVTHALTESLQKPPSLRQSSANVLARQLRHIEQLSTHVSTPPPAGVAPPEPPRVAPRISVALDPAVSATTHAFVVAIPAKASCGEPVEDAAKTSELDLDELFGAVIETHAPIVVDSFADLPVPQDAVAQGLAPQGGEPRGSRMRLHRKRLRSTIVAKYEMPQNGPPFLPDVEKGTPAVAARITPTMIDWDQPDDDIPSMADVLEVLSKENASDRPLLSNPDKPIPAPIMLRETQDAISKVVWLGEEPSPDRADNWTHQDYLDDSLVTRIELKPSVGNEPDRRPVFLRKDLVNETARTNREPIFSTYYSSSARGSLPRRRLLSVGACLVIATAVVLFANGSLTSYLPGGTDGDRVTAKASPAPVPLTDKGPAGTASTSQRKTRRPSAEIPRDVDDTKTRRKTAPAGKTTALRSQNNSKPHAIYANERKVIATARPAKTPVALLTRPRIVRNH